jgi:hypothetical protein
VPTEAEIAYVAGFFDGEGCIAARVNPAGYTSLQVSIGQSDLAQLEYVQGVIGGTITPIKGKEHWHLGLRHAETVAFLEAAMPYLRLKRPQAELALEFLSYGNGQGCRVPEPARSRKLEIVTELRQLKKGA